MKKSPTSFPSASSARSGRENQVVLLLALAAAGVSAGLAASADVAAPASVAGRLRGEVRTLAGRTVPGALVLALREQAP
ncbi:MAG: hypothetical protein JSV80_09260, partial [Acidobacteriota bacterium]